MLYCNYGFGGALYLSFELISKKCRSKGLLIVCKSCTEQRKEVVLGNGTIFGLTSSHQRKKPNCFWPTLLDQTFKCQVAIDNANLHVNWVIDCPICQKFKWLYYCYLLRIFARKLLISFGAFPLVHWYVFHGTSCFGLWHSSEFWQPVATKFYILYHSRGNRIFCTPRTRDMKKGIR